MKPPVSADLEPFPTPEFIAGLAVQLMCGWGRDDGQPARKGLNEREAVELALSVCREAVNQLHPMPSKPEAELDSCLLPARFPASINEFVQIVVPGHGEGDKLALFKHFLRYRQRNRLAMELRELRASPDGILPPRLPLDEIPEIGIEEGGELFRRECRIQLDGARWTRLVRGFQSWNNDRRKQAGKKAAEARWKKSQKRASRPSNRK